jgi:DNA-directed RNA polymerase subunit RPC12/RpoP
MDRYTFAILTLGEYKTIDIMCNSLSEAIDIAIEALEKQVAKPVVVNKRDGYIMPDYHCPMCGERILHSYFRQRDGVYCEKCGQRVTF